MTLQVPLLSTARARTATRGRSAGDLGPVLKPGQDGVIAMTFLLLPGFDMMSLGSAVGALQSANTALGREAFRWRLESWDGQPVPATEGWSLPVDGPARSAQAASATWLCCGLRPCPSSVPPGLPDHLRRQWREGRLIGGIGSAAFVLAAAGILHGHRFTLRWEDLAAFRATWPKLDPGTDLFCIDRRIATCAGGVAAAEMMLYIVSAHFGPAVAQEAMHGCRLSSARPGHMDQILPVLSRIPGRCFALQRALEIIEAHFLEQRCLDSAAAAAGVSMRQLQRLFDRHLGKTPHRHVADLRVAHGRSLLEHTNMSVAEVALACGYDQTPPFSKAFARRFGTKPSRYTHFGIAPTRSTYVLTP